MRHGFIFSFIVLKKKNIQYKFSSAYEAQVIFSKHPIDQVNHKKVVEAGDVIGDQKQDWQRFVQLIRCRVSNDSSFYVANYHGPNAGVDSKVAGNEALKFIEQHTNGQPFAMGGDWNLSFREEITDGLEQHYTPIFHGSGGIDWFITNQNPSEISLEKVIASNESLTDHNVLELTIPINVSTQT